MQRDARAFLWDVREAAQAIQSFTQGMDAIHGYAGINASTVWNIAQDALPALLSTVQSLLDELA